MTDYLIALAYILIGVAGAVAHWFKKRYIDETTCCSLWDYVRKERKHTMRTVWSILTSEIALAAASIIAGAPFGLNAVIGALTAGYVADSVVNKAPDG